MELTPEELEIIKKRREQGQALDNAANFPIVKAEDLTLEQKAVAYDQLHAFALSVWNDKKKQGYVDEDTSQYAYEAIMGLLAPEDRNRDFWQAFNKLGDRQ